MRCFGRYPPASIKSPRLPWHRLYSSGFGSREGLFRQRERPRWGGRPCWPSCTHPHHCCSRHFVLCCGDACLFVTISSDSNLNAFKSQTAWAERLSDRTERYLLDARIKRLQQSFSAALMTYLWLFYQEDSSSVRYASLFFERRVMHNVLLT